MKKFKNSIYICMTIFGIIGLILYGIPIALAFATWHWEIITINFLLLLLRIDIVLSAIIFALYFVSEQFLNDGN